MLKSEPRLKGQLLPLILILPIFFTLPACKNKSSDTIKANQEVNKDIINNEFLFLPELISIGNRSVNFNNNKKKILVIGEADCGRCFEKMDRWKNFNHLNDLKNYDIIFLIVGEDNTLLNNYLKTEKNNNLMIYLDKKSSFTKDMKLYPYIQETLVLNEKNRIIYVGDPTVNINVLNDLKLL